jgi:hypothetical protein
MSFPVEEFDVLEEDELALLIRRLERMHELEPGEYKEELLDMLSVRQARTLHRRLSRADEGQGQLQAPTMEERKLAHDSTTSTSTSTRTSRD